MSDNKFVFNDFVFDTTEAALFTGLSVTTLVKLRRDGGGPKFIKMGRNVMYLRAEVVVWLAGRRDAAPDARRRVAKRHADN